MSTGVDLAWGWRWAWLLVGAAGFPDAARVLRQGGVAIDVVRTAEADATRAAAPLARAAWAAGLALQAAHVMAALEVGDRSEGDWRDVECLLAGAAAAVGDLLQGSPLGRLLGPSLTALAGPVGQE